MSFYTTSKHNKYVKSARKFLRSALILPSIFPVTQLNNNTKQKQIPQSTLPIGKSVDCLSYYGT